MDNHYKIEDKLETVKNLLKAANSLLDEAMTLNEEMILDGNKRVEGV